MWELRPFYHDSYMAGETVPKKACSSVYPKPVLRNHADCYTLTLDSAILISVAPISYLCVFHFMQLIPCCFLRFF